MTERCASRLNAARIRRNIREGNESGRWGYEAECLWVSTVWRLANCEALSHRLRGYSWLDKDVGWRCGKREGKHFTCNNDLEGFRDTCDGRIVCERYCYLNRVSADISQVACWYDEGGHRRIERQVRWFSASEGYDSITAVRRAVMRLSYLVLEKDILIINLFG